MSIETHQAEKALSRAPSRIGGRDMAWAGVRAVRDLAIQAATAPLSPSSPLVGEVGRGGRRRRSARRLPPAIRASGRER